MTLDYGYKSKCCVAPIRFGFKDNKKTGLRQQIMICCRCKKRDIDIITNEEASGQVKSKDHFADDFRL